MTVLRALIHNTSLLEIGALEPPLHTNALPLSGSIFVLSFFVDFREAVVKRRITEGVGITEAVADIVVMAF